MKQLNYAIIGILLIMSIPLIIAQPEGGNFTTVGTERRTPDNPSNLTASAGNITQLNIIANTVTQTWQGYVGNVSGSIVLQDAGNNPIYNWTLADPEGEIYATYEPSIVWTNIICWNWSSIIDEDLTLAELEQGSTSNPDLTSTLGAAGLGLADDDADGVNETFNESGAIEHSSFYVGSTYINGSVSFSCPAVKLYNSTGEGAFEQVILYDNQTKAAIFTSILVSDKIGYDGDEWDFQLIVGDNGHDGDDATTTYYFYVELE